MNKARNVLKLTLEGRTGRLENSAKRELALALRSIRKKARLTQVQLSQRTGWSQPFISRLEAPTGALPSTQHVIDYANACQARATVHFDMAGGDAVTANLNTTQDCGETSEDEMTEDTGS